MRSMPRLAATAVTGSLALAVLGLPGVALAAGPDAPPAAAEARPAPLSSNAADAPDRSAAVRATPASTPTALPSAAALPFVGPRAQDVIAPVAPQARRAEAARPAKPAPRPASPSARPAKPAAAKAPATSKAARTAAASAPKTDPRGNNGTFKVDGPVLDTSRGNEPHVTCEFRLSFFGYDAGQLGRITFTAIAPTPGPTTRIDGLPLISASSAKGGQYDGSYPTAGTLTAADLGLDATVAHHVKAQVESVNADGSEVPGGAKAKVFWLEPCAAAAPADVATEVTPVPVAAQAGTPVFGPRAVVAAPPAATAAPAETAVLAGSVSAQSVTPSTVVAAPALLLPQGVGTATARPAALPFTGSPQTLILLMLGVVTVVGGSALLVAVRRAP